MEPLKPSNVDRIRNLEDQLAGMRQQLAQLQSTIPANRRQTQSVQTYGGYAANSNGVATNARFLRSTADAPLDTKRKRIFRDPTLNGRGYPFRSFLCDNFGPAGSMAHIIPPHHDFELFNAQWSGHLGVEQNTSSSTVTLAIPRIAYDQTVLHNLRYLGGHPTPYAFNPGAYLVHFDLSIPITRTIDSGSNQRAGHVRLETTSPNIYNNENQRTDQWGRQVTWGSGTNQFMARITAWVLWKPSPGGTFDWRVAFSNCITNTATAFLGTVLFIELGKAETTTGINTTGTTTQSFGFSNLFFETPLYTSTADVIESGINVDVIPE